MFRRLCRLGRQTVYLNFLRAQVCHVCWEASRLSTTTSLIWRECELNLRRALLLRVNHGIEESQKDTMSRLRRQSLLRSTLQFPVARTSCRRTIPRQQIPRICPRLNLRLSNKLRDPLQLFLTSAKVLSIKNGRFAEENLVCGPCGLTYMTIFHMSMIRRFTHKLVHSHRGWPFRQRRQTSAVRSPESASRPTVSSGQHILVGNLSHARVADFLRCEITPLLRMFIYFKRPYGKLLINLAPSTPPNCISVSIPSTHTLFSVFPNHILLSSNSTVLILCLEDHEVPKA
eukprot:284815708_3